MEPSLEFVQNNLMYVILAVASGGMLLWQMLGSSGGDRISPLQATLLLNRDDALMIDVREASEWSAGHIPNARHIALGQIEKQIHEIEKYKTRPVIVSCQTGNRATTACTKLKKRGFEKVFNLAGGVAAWSEAGLPMTTR